MLWACDLNLVRGEDSLVRALWAGQAFIWHIYPQDDNAHHAKLEAFLKGMQAPESLRRAHRVWNGIENTAWPPVTSENVETWSDCATAARNQLLIQTPLHAQLMAFVQVQPSSP